MVNILAPAKPPTYVKVANFPGLYRHARSGRYYACKKHDCQRWMRRSGQLGRSCFSASA